MTVTLCVLLWTEPGHEELLVEYEDHVLGLLPSHEARVLQRVRTGEAGAGPYEVQILEFASDAALDAYMKDPARLARSELRERAIARTEVLAVDRIS